MSDTYKVGILTMQLEGHATDNFRVAISDAGQKFAALVEDLLPVEVELLTITGQHFVPRRGAFEPLDFMEVAISEKVERSVSFLIVVTEVELASKHKSYIMAMASQATNIAIVSTKRLGDASPDLESQTRLIERRLTTLLLRTFGRLLNLPLVDEPTNIMRPLTDADILDHLERFTDHQSQQMLAALPKEALDRSTESGKPQFIVSTLVQHAGNIVRIAWQAHPFHLLSKLPTMLATALSVIVVLLFSAETWDYSTAVAWPQLMLFSVVAFAASTFLLYRAFSLPSVTSRRGALSESVVVTAAATLLALFMALATMFVLLSTMMFLGAGFIFPDSLKETWTTVQDARLLSDHIKLSVFLATVGVLSGSLGGAADNRELVRSVLFVSEDD